MLVERVTGTEVVIASGTEDDLLDTARRRRRERCRRAARSRSAAARCALTGFDGPAFDGGRVSVRLLAPGAEAAGSATRRSRCSRS